jgi:hypothetical protein
VNIKQIGNSGLYIGIKKDFKNWRVIWNKGIAISLNRIELTWLIFLYLPSSKELLRDSNSIQMIILAQK